MQEAVNEEWTFKDADIHYMTHGLHAYPAKMIPQVARGLIEKYSKSKEDLILDPFCGSGGVLVEAVLSGRNAVGIDLNPLACLMARVKSKPLDPTTLFDYWNALRTSINKNLSLLKTQKITIEAPNFGKTNIDYWFKPYVVKELALIKSTIDEQIKETEVREFFSLAFSSTVRVVSGTRNGEFKLYRIPEEKWEVFSPNVFEIYCKTVNMSISKMGEFFVSYTKNRLKSKAEVFEGNTSKLFTDDFPEAGKKKLIDESVKLIVTSPPYGDSRTTVAYGQFSRYPLIWLGHNINKTIKIDKEILGGRPNGKKVKSLVLDNVLSKIPNKNRASEVESYFGDLNDCLKPLSRVLANEGHACFVLGNRTVNGIRIPTDKILTELGGQLGFKLVKVIHREIPYKRMPLKSSPTNVAGQKVDTMKEENIVILKKET